MELGMKIRRTARIRLEPTAEQAAAFEETRRQYADAFNAVSEAGWDAKRINGVELHNATYRALRKRLALPSQLVISARVKAVETLKSTRALARIGKSTARPKMQNPSVRFDERSYRLDWKTLTVRFTVVGGRIELPFKLNEHSSQFCGLPTASADLVKRQGRWYLHVVVEEEAREHERTGKVVGVDRGIRRPAVTSDGQFLGEPRWRAIEERMLSTRRRLQAKGTGSAKRHLKRLSDRLARFRRDCDHVLSKRLVESTEPGDTLVFEDLTHIRTRVRCFGSAQRRRLHAWSFARLERLVAYKAALRGILLASVDARDTSRRCPKCGLIEGANRTSQRRFRCVLCGYERNADLVGAWNIRDQHRGLWSPVSGVPGRVNGLNVGAHYHSRKPRPLGRGS